MRTIRVSVTTRSSRRRMVWLSPDEAKVWVHAAPERGKANEEVCRVVAEACRVRRGDVRIVQGERSSKKVIVVDGQGPD
jgi:uncharacterized protein (TIGR00251 family)